MDWFWLEQNLGTKTRNGQRREANHPNVPTGQNHPARRWSDGGRAQAPTPGDESTNETTPTGLHQGWDSILSGLMIFCSFW